MLTKTITAAEKEQARNLLKKFLVPGDYVAAQVTHTARSGGLHVIQVLIAHNDDRTGRPVVFDRTSLVAKAAGLRYDPDRRGIVVKGCGSSPTAGVVYDLAHALFGDGYALKENRL